MNSKPTEPQEPQLKNQSSLEKKIVEPEPIVSSHDTEESRAFQESTQTQEHLQTEPEIREENGEKEEEMFQKEVSKSGEFEGGEEKTQIKGQSVEAIQNFGNQGMPPNEQIKSAMVNSIERASIEAQMITNAQRRMSDKDQTLNLNMPPSDQTGGMPASTFNMGLVPQNQTSFFSNSQSMFQNILYNMDNPQEAMNKNIDVKGNPVLLKQMNANKMMYGPMGQQMGPFMQMHPMGVNGQGKMFMGPNRGSNIVSPNYEESPSHFCLEHRTISNLICLTDQKIICSNCALFGIHKGHDYVKFDNFKNDCRAKLQNLQNEFEKIRFKRFLREGDKEAQFIREKVEDRKRLLFNDLEKLTSDLIKKIREQESEVKKKIDKNFEKFESVIDEWSNVQMKIKDKSENIEHRLQKLGKAVSARQTDFQFLLENLYNKSEQNPMDEISRLTEEVLKNEGTATAFVEAELGKYEIKSNEAKLREVIQFESIKLFYDGTLMDDKQSGLSYMNQASEQSREEDSKGEADSKPDFDVEEGIGFDLRRSINFDINKELEANALHRANMTPMKPSYLSAVKEKHSEERTPLSKLRSKGGFNIQSHSRNQFDDDRSRHDRPSITHDSLNYLNVSNIEKNPRVKEKIREEEVDRINVSQLTDISGGMVPPKRGNKNSYTIYDAQGEDNGDDDQDLLETIENDDLDDAFGEDFDQQSLSRGEENILNNSLEGSHNLYGQNMRRLHSKEQEDPDEENLYQTNNFEDVDFMNEELDENPDNDYEVLKDLKMDGGRRGMGAPKNSIINLNNRRPHMNKKKSEYNLYNKSKTREAGRMTKNKNHRSQANFQHKRTKTGFSSTGTGFLQQVTNKSQNKKRHTKMMHNNSGEHMGAKGYHTQRIPSMGGDTRANQANLRRKKSHNKATKKQGLRIDTSHSKNYQSR